MLGGREEEEEWGAGAAGDGEVIPVSSRFWVRSAGQELLVTPTREAVTWGSPLYTFRWLLDRGNCGMRWGEGRGEQPPLQGGPSPGPIIPGTAIPRDTQGKLYWCPPGHTFSFKGSTASSRMSESTLGLFTQQFHGKVCRVGS